MDLVLTFSILIAIILIITALFYWKLLHDATHEFSFKRFFRRKSRVYSDEEIIEELAVMIFDHVQNNQIGLFSEMIVYYGYDQKRHLKSYLNFENKLENQKITLYLNIFYEMFEQYRKIDSKTDLYGHLTPQFLIPQKAQKIKVESIDIIRVYIQLCSGDDDESCSEPYTLDFVNGGPNNFLLLDIQELQLYKKFTSYNGTYRF